MAKIIIEVDDDFIREKANPETAKANLKPEATGGAVIKAMFDMIACSCIEKRIDHGKTEFRVTREMMDDDTKRDFFDRNVADVLIPAFMADPDKDK